MTGVQAARMWMLLQTEKSLGLESVPWKAAPDSVSAKPLPARPIPPIRTPAMPVRPIPPRAQQPAAAPTPPRASAPVIPANPPHTVQPIQNMPVDIAQTIDLPLAQRTSELTAPRQSREGLHQVPH